MEEEQEPSQRFPLPVAVAATDRSEPKDSDIFLSCDTRVTSLTLTAGL